MGWYFGVFVDFANPICEFVDFLLDFLRCGSRLVILSHHGAISSQSFLFVRILLSNIERKTFM
jgi:hypothetical protein